MQKYRCHSDGGPMNHKLRCDSAHHQIVLGVGWDGGETLQKRNLIILDIDLTILEAAKGIPDGLVAGKLPFHQIHPGQIDLEVLFIGFIFDSETHKRSIVFRKHFFDFLIYINENSEFSADLVLYTAARPEYARQVALGIDEVFQTKYGNISDSHSLFKMVISCRNHNTAKTISTLGHHLDLKKYASIIVLDDNGRNCWCKYQMIQLKKRYNVKFVLIQVPEFHVWEEANLRFAEVSASGRRPPTFTHLVTRKQNKDNFFYHFCLYLKRVHRNESLLILFEYAFPIHDVLHYRLGILGWWQWFMFQFTDAVIKPVTILKPINSSNAKIKGIKKVSFRV